MLHSLPRGEGLGYFDLALNDTDTAVPAIGGEGVGYFDC
jgi:hypothetical protein